MTRKPLSDFLIASCTEDGATYRFNLYEDGTVEETQKIPMSTPRFLELQNDTLWAILRTPFKDSSESGVAAYDLNTGKQLCDIISTKGDGVCHIAVCDNDVYCTNYISGSIIKIPDRLDVHTGCGVNKERQASPHIHSVMPAPGKKHLVSCDLGLDTVFVYDRDLNLVSKEKCVSGGGVRHCVFSKDGKYLYCVNEMGASVSVFAFDEPNLKLLDTVSIFSSEYSGTDGAGSAIKISNDGSYLYATERVSKKIATLEIDGEKMKLLALTDCCGDEPRDFTLLADDKFAVCTNQFSNNVSIFKISDDRIPIYLNSFELPAPLCAIEIPAR